MDPPLSEGVEFGEEVKGAGEPLSISAEQRRLHYIQREYAAVAKDPIEGIYVTPSAQDPLEWYGLLIVRAGIFIGGMFRFTLTLQSDFPDSTQMPAVHFDDNLFHPLINPKTNLTDLSRFFPSGWQRDRNHVYQVLTATQSMFFRCRVDTAQAVNPEAAILLAENPTKFKQMARDAVRRSRTQIYDPPTSEDPNSIRFTPWNHEMEPLREYLVGKRPFAATPLIHKGAGPSSVGRLTPKAGYSWMDVQNCRYMVDILSPKPAEQDIMTRPGTINANGDDEEPECLSRSSNDS